MLDYRGTIDSAELGARWQSLLDIDRGVARALGLEAIDWIAEGRYVAPSGRVVDIATLVDASMAATVSVPPERSVSQPAGTMSSTLVDVSNESSLAAAARLMDEGHVPLVLNMASGISPGGGFLSGARAQEEYLCRSSALWATIRDDEMYPTHATREDYESSDWMIVSPQVPVFRDDAGSPLEQPWHANVITSAAPVAHRVGAERSALLMERRIDRLLAVSAEHGYRALVLGAWGCGAFGNDVHATARAFRTALVEHYAGVFHRVTFAITDWSPDRRFLGPFAAAFGH